MDSGHTELWVTDRLGAGQIIDWLLIVWQKGIWKRMQQSGSQVTQGGGCLLTGYTCNGWTWVYIATFGVLSETTHHGGRAARTSAVSSGRYGGTRRCNSSEGVAYPDAVWRHRPKEEWHRPRGHHWGESSRETWRRQPDGVNLMKKEG